MLSPLYVAVTVYVPATGVEITQPYAALCGALAGLVNEVHELAAPLTTQVTVPVGAAKLAEPVTV